MIAAIIERVFALVVSHSLLGIVGSATMLAEDVHGAEAVSLNVLVGDGEVD